MTKHLIKIVAFFTVLFLISTCAPLNTSISTALADSDAKLRTITVSGSSKASVTPDYTVVSLGVTYTDKSVEKAQSESNTKINAILAALKDLGIKDKSVSTSNYSINPIYDYNNNDSVLKGYEVNYTISIKIVDIDLTGKVIDSCVKAGANFSYGISFESSNTKEAYEKALAEAVVNAKQKAKIIANASDVKLGELIDASEMGNYSYNNYSEKMYATSAIQDSVSTPIMSDDIDISASITLTFAIDD